MTVLWSGREIAQVLEGVSVPHLGTWASLLQRDDIDVKGVSIDTRTLQPGDLFVPLQGENGDGHGYILQAMEKGAVGALVAQSQWLTLQVQLQSCGKTFPCFVVTDPFAALVMLGQGARHRTEAKIIGITGSVGKTSVRHLLSTLLGFQGLTASSQKSYNNHWGVPLSLAQMPREAAYGVFEMGMNAPGEILALTQQVRPHVALITRVGDAHLGPLGSREAVADAKAEIFKDVKTAVLHQDFPYFDRLKQRAQDAGVARIVTVGHLSAGCPTPDVLLRQAAETTDGHHLHIEVKGRSFALRCIGRGSHWIDNALLVLGGLEAVGADVEQAAADYEKVGLLEGRGKVVQISCGGGGQIVVLDDSYNANPTSMQAGLEALGRTPLGLNPVSGAEGRRIAVLGDMRELGEMSEAFHLKLESMILAVGAHKFFGCGKLMQILYNKLSIDLHGDWADSSEEIGKSLCQYVRPGDVVMVKGSNSMQMWRVIEQLKSAFAVQQS